MRALPRAVRSLLRVLVQQVHEASWVLGRGHEDLLLLLDG